MSSRRVALLVTCAVVVALGVAFLFVSADAGDRLAAIVAAMAAVAAVGVAIWAALPDWKGGAAVTVRGSGNAVAGAGGVANTGVTKAVAGPVEVENTGDADASGGGSANSGAWLD